MKATYLLKKKKKRNIPVHEHLDVALKTTYAQRLQWLEEANEFVLMVEQSKIKSRCRSHR